MDQVKIIQLKKTILENNDADAEVLRGEQKDRGLVSLNVMSSPGSGKTTTLLGTIHRLKNEFRIGVMEADIDSDVDAQNIQDTEGVPAVQLHTGGMCHLDAQMTRQGFGSLGAQGYAEDGTPTQNFPAAAEDREASTEASAQSSATDHASLTVSADRPEGFDLVILENVGNLVCPAEFDTGCTLNVVIYSIPEGDDKPQKYPLMFEKADVVLINKIDALPVFDFDMETASSWIHKRNANVPIFPISAKTGEGMDAWCDWLRNQIKSGR